MTAGSVGLAWARMAAGKLGWGIRTVGIGATLRGAVRLAVMRIRRPRQSEITLKSGAILEFEFPSQFPSALVLFGDLIDPEFSFLREVVRHDWIVVDVGAAIGQFTVFAARLPVARVYAFEPSGLNVRTLERNIARNNVSDRVQISQSALSNTQEEAHFETTACAWMSRLGSTTGEVVRVQKLPDALNALGLTRISVLKINVAGFEPEVLEGAQPVLAAGRADILILLLGLESLKWYARIASLGYRFFYYHPKMRTLHEVRSFTQSDVLDHRPWPARHIIAIRSAAIAQGIVSDIGIELIR